MKIRAVSVALATIILLSLVIPLSVLWITLNMKIMNTINNIQVEFIKNLKRILNDVIVQAVLENKSLKLLVGSRNGIKISKIVVYNLTNNAIKTIELNSTDSSTYSKILIASNFSAGKLDIIIVDEDGRIYRYDPRFDPQLRNNPHNNDPFLDPKDFISNTNAQDNNILHFLVLYDLIGLKVLETNYTIASTHLEQVHIPSIEVYARLYHYYTSSIAYYQGYVKVDGTYEVNTGWTSGNSASFTYKNTINLVEYANVRVDITYTVRLTFKIDDKRRLYDTVLYTIVCVKAYNNSTKKALIAIPSDLEAYGDLVFSTGTLPAKYTKQQDPYQEAYRLTQFKYIISEPGETCELYHKAYASSAYYYVYGTIDVTAKSCLDTTGTQILVILLEEK